jgi:hypothetical protein
MSSLSLISNHLFIEAAGRQDNRRKPARDEKPANLLDGIATAIPLELLEATEPIPADTTPLRTDACPSPS